MAGFYASKGHGAVFFPEVDDEVIVGFLNDDPSSPIILGSVYSASRSMPYSPDVENNTKAIVTWAEMKVVFDEKKKEITIATPAGNEIVFSDKRKGITLNDQNSNQIKMSSSGIDLISKKSIRITAKESIELSGDVGVALKSKVGDVSLAGMNVKSKANIEFKASGMTTTIEGGGRVALQGVIIIANEEVLSPKPPKK